MNTPESEGDGRRVFSLQVVGSSDFVKHPELLQRHFEMVVEMLDARIDEAGYVPDGEPLLHVYAERLATPRGGLS